MTMWDFHKMDRRYASFRQIYSARVDFRHALAATPASFCEPNSRDAERAVIFLSYVLNVNTEIENK